MIEAIFGFARVCTLLRGIFKVQRLKYLLIGAGFFWIFAWSVFGTLIGAKINLIYTTGADQSWLAGAQKSLFTAAHSHMNSMALTTILFGLTLPYLNGLIPTNLIKTVALLNLISVPCFGFGLLLESFYPPIIGQWSPFIIMSSLGAVFYMLTMAVWCGFFLMASLKRS